MKIDGFDWDEGNIDKCEKHGVSIQEIELVFEHDPLIFINKKHPDEEQRYTAVDLENKRSIYIIYTIRIRQLRMVIRPISARYMHEKEKKYYEKQKRT